MVLRETMSCVRKPTQVEAGSDSKKSRIPGTIPKKSSDLSDPTMESGNSRQLRLRLAETLGGLDLFGSHFLVREDLLHEIQFFFHESLESPLVHGRGNQSVDVGVSLPWFQSSVLQFFNSLDPGSNLLNEWNDEKSIKILTCGKMILCHTEFQSRDLELRWMFDCDFLEWLFEKQQQTPSQIQLSILGCYSQRWYITIGVLAEFAYLFDPFWLVDEGWGMIKVYIILYSYL